MFAGAAQTATDNDLAAGTAFHSIEVEAAGFSIAGHAIALPNGADLALTTGSANISANVILGGELHAVVNPSCTLTMLGVLSESMPHAGGLNVRRGGTLVLSGVGTYSGLTTVYGGTLELGADAQSPVLTGAPTSKAARSCSTTPPPTRPPRSAPTCPRPGPRPPRH